MKIKKKLLSGLFLMFVFLGLKPVQVNAAEFGRQADVATGGNSYHTTIIDNKSKGWVHGSMGYCDRNGYSVFYANNTSKGGYKYQKVWIDSDKYPKVSSTKAYATASVTSGANNSYKKGFSDHN